MRIAVVAVAVVVEWDHLKKRRKRPFFFAMTDFDGLCWKITSVVVDNIH